MKIAFDEHVPGKVLRALAPLLEDGRNGGVVIVSARDYRDRKPAESDVPWLELFAKDGGGVVISGDAAMRRKPHERQALLELGLIVVFLPPHWNRERFNKKSAFILQWWDTILALTQKTKPPKQYQLPNSLNTNNAVRDVTGPRPTPAHLRRRVMSVKDSTAGAAAAAGARK